MFSAARQLVLASGSRYRKAQLEQLGLRFVVCVPNIDESPRAGESPTDLAARLAAEKSLAAAAYHPRALIVGSDQVATLDGRTTFGKPADHDDAVRQLMQMSDCTAYFHSAVNLLNAGTGVARSAVVTTEVRYRALNPSLVESYLRRDTPYDCAGSARIEGLGIALVRHVRSDDPSALLGLPLIALTNLLAAEGVDVIEPLPSR